MFNVSKARGRRMKLARLLNGLSPAQLARRCALPVEEVLIVEAGRGSEWALVRMTTELLILAQWVLTGSMPPRDPFVVGCYAENALKN